MPGGVAARGRDLLVSYGRRVAIAPSEFTIPAGGLTAIIGPNGSGKSTLLNVLTGLVTPAGGTVEVLGRAPVDARRHVAYVLQTNVVNEAVPITVREVVAMGRYAELGRFRRFDPRDHELVAAAMDRLAVADLAGRHLGELSGGQRQRVFVAQGLAQDADLLLLDEPVTGLDVVSRARIVDVVREELDRGATVVFTTHDLADAAEADHVLLMAGRVFAQGPPDDVLDPGLLAEAYGVGVLHFEGGPVVLDDTHHGTRRHVHYERRA